MSDDTSCSHLQFIGSREFCPDCGLSRSEALVEACAPYLKDDETPAECIARNRRDTDGVLSLLIAARRDNERLRSVADGEMRLREGTFEQIEALAADNERLREALIRVRGHTAYYETADRELLAGLLATIERITDAALAGAADQPAAAHEVDDDGVCTRCGFDAAEWWHIERMKPKSERETSPPCTPDNAAGGG